MKKYFLILSLLFSSVFSLSISAQQTVSDSIKSLPKGIGRFRNDVARQIDLSGFVWNQPFNLVVTFIVSKEGKMENIKLEESSGNEEFDQRIIDGLKRLRKKKWTPAMKNGEPVESFFRLPLTLHPPK